MGGSGGAPLKAKSSPQTMSRALIITTEGLLRSQTELKGHRRDGEIPNVVITVFWAKGHRIHSPPKVNDELCKNTSLEGLAEYAVI